MEGDQLKLLSPPQQVQSSYTHKVTGSSQSYKLCTLLKATICWNTIMNIEYFHPSDIINFRLKACSVLAQTVQRCWQLCGSWWEKSVNMRRVVISLNSYLMKCSEMIRTLDWECVLHALKKTPFDIWYCKKFCMWLTCIVIFDHLN